MSTFMCSYLVILQLSPLAILIISNHFISEMMFSVLIKRLPTWHWELKFVVTAMKRFKLSSSHTCHVKYPYKLSTIQEFCIHNQYQQKIIYTIMTLQPLQISLQWCGLRMYFRVSHENNFSNNFIISWYVFPIQT